MRIELDRMAEVLDRVRILAELGVDDAARVVGGRVSDCAGYLSKGGDIARVGRLSPGFGINLRYMRVQPAERLTACRER